MARKQTRRSISISRETYDRLKIFCEGNNTSMSGFVDMQINLALDAKPVEVTVPPEAIHGDRHAQA